MTSEFTPGGYRYIPAVFQYSSGVAARPDYTISSACGSTKRCRWQKV